MDFYHSLAEGRVARPRRDELEWSVLSRPIARLNAWPSFAWRRACDERTGRTKLLRCGHELPPLRKPRGQPSERGSTPVRPCPWGKSSDRYWSEPAGTRSRYYEAGSKLRRPVRIHEVGEVATVERISPQADASAAWSEADTSLLATPAPIAADCTMRFASD